MRSQIRNEDKERPLHVDIRLAINELGVDGFDEVREALHSGFEDFEAQMNRRMKTRLPERRDAYKTLRDGGEDKVRVHLAAVDLEGLSLRRRRRKRPLFDRSRLVRRRTVQGEAKGKVAIS